MALETINGKPLAIEVEGAGAPVVLVHGLGGTGNIWEPQVRALAGRFRFLRLDLEGSGRSPLQGKLTIEGWIADILAAMDKHGMSSAALVGHSLGALIVQHLAARHPARVSKAALVGAVTAPAEAGRKGLAERAAKVRADGMEAVADAIVKGATAETTRARRPEVAAFARELLMRQPAEGYARSCEALAAASAPDLAAARCPFLLVVGAQDAVAPAATANAIASRLSQARIGTIEDSGHWLTIEQPQRVSDCLGQFL